MQIGPLRHKFERASRQITDKHLAAPDRNHRVVLGVLGVEMGRFVIVEVHRDRDAVEEADPGHLAIMTRAWDGLARRAPPGQDPADECLPWAYGTVYLAEETPQGHAVSFDESGDLVGLTLVDIRRLLDEAQGDLRLQLPAKASPADLEIALA